MAFQQFKLGRNARIHNPAVPHLSALTAGKTLDDPPAEVDYLTAMPDDLGMMLNDRLGCCTIAAMYHAIQVWTFNALGGTSTAMQTNPDHNVLNEYEWICGYDPNHPATDQGGIEQNVLGFWHNKGIVCSAAPNQQKNKLFAWIEVDPRNQDDIKRVIDQCGVCYIGFEVPANIMPNDAPPPRHWQLHPHARIIGGHAVPLGKYNAQTVGLISWGSPRYEMDWDFFHYYTDEAYALVDIDWVNATGKTPLGLSVQQLAAQMRALVVV